MSPVLLRCQQSVNTGFSFGLCSDVTAPNLATAQSLQQLSYKHQLFLYTCVQIKRDTNVLISDLDGLIFMLKRAVLHAPATCSCSSGMTAMSSVEVLEMSAGLSGVMLSL